MHGDIGGKNIERRQLCRLKAPGPRPSASTGGVSHEGARRLGGPPCEHSGVMSQCTWRPQRQEHGAAHVATTSKPAALGLRWRGQRRCLRVDVRPTGDPKLRVRHASNAASRRSVRVDVATSAARTLGGRGRATSVRGGVRRRRASCVHGAGTRRRCRCASAMTWLRRRSGEQATVNRAMRASEFTSERIVERATCERANASD